MPPELATESLMMIVPYAVFGFFSIAIAAVFYFYRLEKIPGLSVIQTLVVLFFCRILDVASFWRVLVASSGAIGEAEINVVHRLLSQTLSHSASFALWLVPSIFLPLIVLYLYYRILLMGGTVPEAKRFAMTAIASVSAISLLGAATNIAFVIFGWNSPFLIG